MCSALWNLNLLLSQSIKILKNSPAQEAFPWILYILMNESSRVLKNMWNPADLCWTYKKHLLWNTCKISSAFDFKPLKNQYRLVTGNIRVGNYRLREMLSDPQEIKIFRTNCCETGSWRSKLGHWNCRQLHENDGARLSDTRMDQYRAGTRWQFWHVLTPED